MTDPDGTDRTGGFPRPERDRDATGATPAGAAPTEQALRRMLQFTADPANLRPRPTTGHRITAPTRLRRVPLVAALIALALVLTIGIGMLALSGNDDPGSLEVGEPGREEDASDRVGDPDAVPQDLQTALLAGSELRGALALETLAGIWTHDLSFSPDPVVSGAAPLGLTEVGDYRSAWESRFADTDAAVDAVRDALSPFDGLPAETQAGLSSLDTRLSELPVQRNATAQSQASSPGLLAAINNIRSSSGAADAQLARSGGDRSTRALHAAPRLLLWQEFETGAVLAGVAAIHTGVAFTPPEQCIAADCMLVDEVAEHLRWADDGLALLTGSLSSEHADLVTAALETPELRDLRSLLHDLAIPARGPPPDLDRGELDDLARAALITLAQLESELLRDLLAGRGATMPSSDQQLPAASVWDAISSHHDLTLALHLEALHTQVALLGVPGEHAATDLTPLRDATDQQAQVFLAALDGAGVPSDAVTALLASYLEELRGAEVGGADEPAEAASLADASARTLGALADVANDLVRHTDSDAQFLALANGAILSSRWRDAEAHLAWTAAPCLLPVAVVEAGCPDSFTLAQARTAWKTAYNLFLGEEHQRDLRAALRQMRGQHPYNDVLSPLLDPERDPPPVQHDWAALAADYLEEIAAFERLHLLDPAPR